MDVNKRKLQRNPVSVFDQKLLFSWNITNHAFLPFHATHQFTLQAFKFLQGHVINKPNDEAMHVHNFGVHVLLSSRKWEERVHIKHYVGT